MKLLWCSVLLPLVFAQTEFGTSFLKNSRLCIPWSCINEEFGLSDSLPSRANYTSLLESLLPAAWQPVIGSALDACYGERPRRYTNTCPGQALMHCVVDQLIENCPNTSLVAKDACAPVTSLAGVRYMFSQSRYNDLEKNLPTERRPAWFLKNYFNSKCCELPPLINDALLARCGFRAFVHYHQQQTRLDAPVHIDKGEKNATDAVRVVSFDNAQTTQNIVEYGEYDPLDCCDVHEFVSPTWRSSCDFRLSWDPESRLSIRNTTTLLPTTTEAPRTLRAKDVKMVPHSCEQNNCVFRALNIVSDSGTVDMDAFSKLLNNLTDVHPAWVRAKGRVLTKCLSRPIRDYDYDCQINKVLACTFDILSENCPNSKTPDVCRHSGATQNEVICQISSSKYRPKNRRLFCGIPSLVKYEVLDQCDLKSLVHLEYVPETVFKPRTSLNSINPMCKDLTPSTVCLLDQMGVLNKYKFLDYFKMKDRIRGFSSGEWFPYSNAYTSVFQSVPLYKQYCSSPKKLLNVLDTMLMTCPYSKRRNSPQCNKLFSDLRSEITGNFTQSEQLTKLFGHVFISNQHLDIGLLPENKQSSVHTNPIYDFGMFNYGNVPPVKTIDVVPKTERPPLILLPVYQRVPESFNVNLYNKEHIMRRPLFVKP